MNPVRVLVVDDSATMRGFITAKLSADRNIEVVGQASDAFQAREAIKALNPDVMTLDIEMPNMDGLAFLEKVMQLRPFPVIMVSSLTQKGAGATIKALEIGAVDYVSKPSSEEPDSFDGLTDKVRMAARARVGQSGASKQQALATSKKFFVPDGKLVALGASTGGVDALIDIISAYPSNCPPTVVTIHMPPLFTKTFANRLNNLSAANVSEAVDGAVLKTGYVYIAPGGNAHLEVAQTDQLRCKLREAPPVNGHRPSVDVLFHSVANVRKAKAVGVILTGMGNDGAAGLLAMRQAGARTLGQNEASCVVYGMPKVAFERSAVEKQLPLGRIADEILTLTSSSNRKG